MFSSRGAPRRLPALLVVAGLLLTACGTDLRPTTSADPVPLPAVTDAPADDPASDPELARFYTQDVTWSGCDDGFRCASVTVPVDWSEPGGETITLAVKKLPASGERIGSLLINPGGPGVSGVEYVGNKKSQFGTAVRRVFDVVGWDPRGVGGSAPITCLTDAEYDRFLAADATPDTPAEVSEAVAGAEAYARACAENTGPILDHVDTLSTVRDMDVLRAVLGDERLSYYGGSYGTFLGAWYAETFPWRVGRLVLDGAVDPSLTTEEYAAGQAEGFQRGLHAYLEDCLKQSGCPLHGTPEQALATLSALIAQADANPLRTGDPDRPLTQSLLVTGLAMGMYSDRFWTAVSAAIGKALQGDGGLLLELADLYNERDASGHYGQVLDANPATYCLDHAEDASVAHIAELATDLGQRYPPFGDGMGWSALGCSTWPVPAVVQPQRLTAAGAAPIVVIGTTGDPATPYEWAQGLAGQLSSGRLVTWEGDGHTAYGRGSSCVGEAVDNYLVAGTAPDDGTVCAR
jgi:pimeloyl-ACP methyl ester carboxylesterase